MTNDYTLENLDLAGNWEKTGITFHYENMEQAEKRLSKLVHDKDLLGNLDSYRIVA